jgi:beta-mannosidase
MPSSNEMASIRLSRTFINADWTFKQADSTENSFLPVAQSPTTIHLGLLHHKRIPDPTRDLNSEEVQWVGEKAWIYRTTFSLRSANKEVRIALVFDGLDTYAAITLNGVEIGKTDNMFLQYRIDATEHIRAGSNELQLRFESAFLVGKELEKKQGFKNLFWNGDSSRMNVRKIGCHYGWDW